MPNFTEKFILPFKHVKSGKVREIYNLEENYLFIASDRISAFDYVLPNGIPEKGKVLTQISLFWFNHFDFIIDNHLVESNFNNFPEELKSFPELEGRSMIVKKAQPLPVECVVRGYLSGSAWKEYQRKKSTCGIDLPEGLLESSLLPEPIFTPATKEESGKHDINIPFEDMGKLVGDGLTEHLRQKSLEIYALAKDYARERGIIIADTKLEFGIADGKIILIDEVLTPDSSRFWDANDYCPGRAQKSFDKQPVRDYLEKTLKWNKELPVPILPEEIARQTSERYVKAYETLTGRRLII